jgi:hypothetical protein
MLKWKFGKLIQLANMEIQVSVEAPDTLTVEGDTILQPFIPADIEVDLVSDHPTFIIW